MNALLEHAREEKEAGRAPDFVFVTGDVAFSGQVDEYEQAVWDDPRTPGAPPAP